MKKNEFPTWEEIMDEAKADEEARKAMLRKRGRDQFKKKNRSKN